MRLKFTDNLSHKAVSVPRVCKDIAWSHGYAHGRLLGILEVDGCFGLWATTRCGELKPSEQSVRPSRLTQILGIIIASPLHTTIPPSSGCSQVSRPPEHAPNSLYLHGLVTVK
jgi:hypothetical protein